MARRLHKLTAVQVRNAKPGMHADGGGLYLQVTESGAKSWIYRFMTNGRARAMGLGSVLAVGLAEARVKAAECRKMRTDKTDPIESRKIERQQAQLEAAKRMTFKECGEAYIKAHEAGWRNAKHAAQWTNTLEAYAYPVIGKLSVQDVDTDLVMKILDPIWRTKTETASRVRGRIEAILDWAAARKYRKGENPARWRGHLDKLLPAKAKVRKVKHHAALPYQKVGAFMADLRQREGLAAQALQFTVLTGTRTIETIGARWDEFDLDNGVWLIPWNRMKAGEEHRVALSHAALAILRKMHETREGDFVFPGAKRGKHLSNMAMLTLLKRMGLKGAVTVHGFRSTLIDWATEQTNFPREVREMALAHTVDDKVEAAYRRSDLFERRRQLMERWADYCGTVPAPTGDNVVVLHQAQ